MSVATQQDDPDVAPAAPGPTRVRRVVRVVAALVAVLVVVTAAGFWFSPIGARWRADAAGQPPAVGVTTVDVVASNFRSASVGIDAGDEVTWRWLDSQEHNVVFEDGETSPVQDDGTWSRTFDRPGEYAYSCTLHLFMSGRVVVDEA